MWIAKLTEAHHRFILNQLASFVFKQQTILDRLKDPDIAEQFGFEPVEITQPRLSQIINKEVDKSELDALRQKWLNDFDDVPLAHKKARVLELVKLYEETDTDDYSSYSAKNAEIQTNSGDRDRKMIKAQILKQIKDEIGEDIDKLANALGQQTNTFNLGFFFLNGSNSEANRLIDANLAAIGGNGRGLPEALVVPENQDKLASLSPGAVLPPNGEESTT